MAGQHGAVYQHAVTLYVKQRLRAGHFNVAVDEVQLAVGRHLRVHSMVQLQCDVGVFCGILGGGFHRHLVKGHLLGAFAGHLFKADWFKA